ncbi:DUF3710 domain-containing protein [Schumannella luteola]|uniref:DUF3710 domain-containing protein n=1 Tax=Schumannella luteola TaxID=472059 RepID=A0A852YFE8_9MICO|nr:DUF3710 domain-containing protein [Schumannella luteola]NYG99881.1 hypothetical protein [Schumannella luteola]TPX02189.1 DUF3710 domain-containing protein [Schumannella luteola]
MSPRQSRKSRKAEAESAVENAEVAEIEADLETEVADDELEATTVAVESGADDEEAVVDQPKSAPEDRDTEGPLDEAESNPVRPYVDLGGVKILPRPELGLRLEVEEGSQRVVAVALDFAESTLQVQPFAAPRSSGLWHEIREQIAEQLRRQGGEVEERDGALGPELLTRIPAPAGAEGGTRVARFVGVDGPRWFLRGVISGKAAVEEKAGAEIEELFRSIVVVRGGQPMPPRDLIPLHVPAGAQPDAG